MNFVESHVECPCGKSSDAYCVNEDGSGKCFSCGKFFKASSEDNWNNIVEWGLMEKNKTFNQKQVVDKTPLDVEFKYVEHRGIYASTYEYFGASAKIDKETKNLIEIGFVYPNQAAKIRQVYPKKGFFVKGDMKSATLFGKNKFDAGALKTITIVEGELDVLSSWQMLGGNSAVVTPRSASSARVDCKAEWEYINAFDKIILCFDNDEPGQKAAQEVASLFDFNKVFKVELTRHKDPTGYLEAGEIKEFNLAWHGAKRFTPDNIISTFSEIAKSLEESEDDLLGTYPFSGLQSALYGLYRGEVVVFKGDEGIGKQLANDTPIPTPTGWTTMGELKIGDVIIGADGKPTNVTFVTEDQYVDCYEVCFNDGSSVIAGGPHKWGVLNQRNKYFVKTTKEILDEGVIASNNASRYSVPIMKPFIGEEKNLPINPYILGVWLGDGNSYSANITVGKQNVQEFEHSLHQRNMNYNKKTEYKTGYSYTVWSLPHAHLVNNNLIKNKHIPKIYLRASEQQRRELLKGLMDTDGGVHLGSCEYYTSSEQLKNDVLELVRSLGYVCRLRVKQSTLYGVNHKVAYTIRFQAVNGFDVFSYPSKANKVTCIEKTRLTKKAIKSITKVRTVPSRCITVDNPDHLYICGDAWTVTHNTETLRAIEHHLLKENKDNKLMLIHLEEPQSRTIKAIATYEDKYPYVHPQSQADNKSVFEAFKRAVDNNESRVYIYKSFDLEDEHKFIDNIRFAVSAGGCQFVFLDHITWLATGIADEDERKKLDRISQRLKLLAEELGFCLIMISHTNDDGKTRGSRNISKVANTVVHMNRDKVSQSEEERNIMYYTIEKARAGGNTGPGGFAIFDKETMRLLDSESVSF